MNFVRFNSKFPSARGVCQWLAATRLPALRGARCSHGPHVTVFARAAGIARVGVFGVLLLISALLVSPCGAQSLSDPNFVVDTIHVGNGTTALAFAPDGSLFVPEKRGVVLVLAPDGAGGYQSARVLADLRESVNSAQEAGLLGLAVDPNFAVNGQLYLFISTATDQRIVRVVVHPNGQQLVQGQDTVLLASLPRQVDFHRGGNIRFRAGEPQALYVSLGDDGRPDEASDLDSYRGKMLRINPIDGLGLPDNPYASVDLGSPRSRIWAIGFRNPFRFTFFADPPATASAIMYVSENGDSTDRLSWVSAGSDGAWNNNGDGGGFLDPPDPGHRVLLTQNAQEGGTSVIGVAIAESGPFTDPAYPDEPVIYNSNWIAPPGGGILRRRLIGPDYSEIALVTTDGGQRFATQLYATHLDFGPDGALYFTQSGGDTSEGDYYQLGRIRFQPGEPPAAVFETSPEPAEGLAPLTVRFSNSSFDTDGFVESYLWEFGDGAQDSAENPTHTYGKGRFTATLTAVDNRGLSSTSTQFVVAREPISLHLSGQLFDAEVLPPVALVGSVVIGVYEQDGSPVFLPQGAGPDQNLLNVPAGGIFDFTLEFETSSPGLVLRVAEGGALAEAHYGLPLPAGGASLAHQLTFYLSRTALRGRLLDTSGAPVRTDIGLARETESGLYAIAGGRDYLPGSGFPLTGVAHRVVSDELGYFYLPVRTTDAGGDFVMDAVGDTGSELYLSLSRVVTVPSGQSANVDLILGIESGGDGCEDLSDVPTTLGVDYESQIQPIWDAACTGCHSAGASNNGNLNLSGMAISRIVGVASNEVPGSSLVAPGNLEHSFLWEKINCQRPQVGTRMRPSDVLPRQSRALVRDWIQQGALHSPAPAVPLFGGAASSSNIWALAAALIALAMSRRV